MFAENRENSDDRHKKQVVSSYFSQNGGCISVMLKIFVYVKFSTEMGELSTNFHFYL